MDSLALSPAALKELARDHAQPWHSPVRADIGRHFARALEVPLFVNGHGPFLLRHAPARLVPIPMRTAYALLRAASSITWPTYCPRQDWVVRAASDFYHGY